MRRLRRCALILSAQATSAMAALSILPVSQVAVIAVNTIKFDLWWIVVGFCNRHLDRGQHKLWRLRMRSCQGCDLYNMKLKTCGTPGETYGDGQALALGCWCFMPLKAKLAHARCWAREENLGFGWPEGLNGHNETRRH